MLTRLHFSTKWYTDNNKLVFLEHSDQFILLNLFKIVVKNVCTLTVSRDVVFWGKTHNILNKVVCSIPLLTSFYSVIFFPFCLTHSFHSDISTAVDLISIFINNNNKIRNYIEKMYSAGLNFSLCSFTIDVIWKEKFH